MAQMSAARNSIQLVGGQVPVRVRVVDQVVEVLSRQILTGSIPRGGQLPPEKILAKQLGVSQPTVREAVRALNILGLLDVRHGSGVFVTHNSHSLISRSLGTLVQLDRVRVLDVLDVRSVLGEFSVLRAVEHATSDDIERIHIALISIESQPDAAAIVKAVEDFQIAVSLAAHNDLLVALECFLIKLIMKFQWLAHAGESAEFWKEWTARPAMLRQEIYQSLADRDPVRTKGAFSRYFSMQHAWFRDDHVLANAHMSDPDYADLMQEVIVGQIGHRSPMRDRPRETLTTDSDRPGRGPTV